MVSNILIFAVVLVQHHQFHLLTVRKLRSEDLPQASPQIQEKQRRVKLEGRTAKEEVQTKTLLCQM